MSNNLALIISIAAFLFSLVSPVTTMIAQIRIRKLELKAEAERRRQEYYDKHRAEAIEKYITAVGEICKTELPDDLHAYGKSMGEIYLYVDQSLWPLLDTIASKINRRGFASPADELIKLCKALSDDKVRAKN